MVSPWNASRVPAASGAEWTKKKKAAVTGVNEEVLGRATAMEAGGEEKGNDEVSPRRIQHGDLSKSSLRFILDDGSSPEEKVSASRSGEGTAVRESPSFTNEPRSSATRPARRTSAAPVPLVAIESPQPQPKRANKRKARRRPPSRICKHEGCEQYVVDQGLCVRHGGGKRCSTPDCTSRAKHKGKCWKHGGSTGCKVPDCSNRAKSRGYCWSHGGGTKCKGGDCEKIAISNGLCWAHGGGKRCIVDGCNRQAYERTQNYCNTHYSEVFGDSADSKQEEDEEEEEDGEGTEDEEHPDQDIEEDDVEESTQIRKRARVTER